MKLIKHDKKQVLKLLKLITYLIKIDLEIIKDFDLHNKYPDKPHQVDELWSEWGFYDFHNVLNVVYLQFTGESEDNVYDVFKVAEERFDAPVAKYVNQEFLGRTFKGFVPDCINEVILASNIDYVDKYDILFSMFSDLRRLEYNHQRAKKKKSKKSA